MYGNYNFWSWLRYWYIDSCNYVNMVLVDKGYFDYDFEKTEAVVRREAMSDEELRDVLAGFGFTQFRKTDEELQDYIIKDMEEK